MKFPQLTVRIFEYPLNGLAVEFQCRTKSLGVNLDRHDAVGKV